MDSYLPADIGRGHTTRTETPSQSRARVTGLQRFRFWGLVVLSNVLVLFAGAVIVELIWEHKYRQDAYEQAKLVRPVYRPSVWTSDGIQVGSTVGPLKLSLRPLLVYATQPNQTTPHFSINSLGLRGGEIPIEKTKTRIVVIGSSMAFGSGLQSDGDTFEHQLAGLVNAEVINAAAIGYGSGQELVEVLTAVVELEPDLLITMDGYNDYWIAAKHRRPNKLFATQGFRQIELQLIKETMLVDAPFLQRVANLHVMLFPHVTRGITNRVDALFPKKLEASHNETDLDVGAAIYAKNIVKMHKLSKPFHYDLLCVFQPDRDKDQEYRYFLDAAKRHLKREGVRYLDLADPNVEEMKPEWFMDDVHLDEAGHRAVAQSLAKHLVHDGLMHSGTGM